jgi:hypothetical protein
MHLAVEHGYTSIKAFMASFDTYADYLELIAFYNIKSDVLEADKIAKTAQEKAGKRGK